MPALSWWEEIDLEWEVEQVILDPDVCSAKCGTCGSSLYTNGTCPVCDRARRNS